MILKYFKIILINLLVIAFLVEMVCMIFIKVKKPVIADYQQIPTYLDIIFEKDKTFKSVLSGGVDSIVLDPLSPRNIDTLYPWCTWHPRNNVHREAYPCFDVTYKFNQFGTRGSIPSSEDSNTAIFVGDSYVEGFGLDEDSTISERFHSKTNNPVLNLGTSGHFGPTQMSLVYSEFAKKFKHRKVFVFFYLENDFIENNVDNHYKLFGDRYRPYRILVKNDSSQIVYKGSIDSTLYSWSHYNDIKKKGFSMFTPEAGFFTKITSLTFTRRCLHMLKSNFNQVKPEEKPSELKFIESDMQILEKDMQSILASAQAQNADVTFVNLPSRYLLKYSRLSNENAKGYKALEARLAGMIHGSNGRFISFYDYIVEHNIPTDSLYFKCDFHYSNYGVEALTQFILSNQSNKK